MVIEKLNILINRFNIYWFILDFILKNINWDIFFKGLEKICMKMKFIVVIVIVIKMILMVWWLKCLFN